MLKDFDVSKHNGRQIVLYGGRGNNGKIIAEGLRKYGIDDFISCHTDAYTGGVYAMTMKQFPLTTQYILSLPGLMQRNVLKCCVKIK